MSLSIDYGYLPIDQRMEPALFISRAGKLVCVGLSVAFHFLDDAEAVKRATAYAVHLFGTTGFTRSEVYKIVQVVTNEFRTLLSMPPPPTLDIMKQAERDRLVVKANGETILDAR